MRKYRMYLAGILLLAAGACTSLSEGQERVPGNAVVNERVTLRSDPAADVLDHMEQQASEINRKRNIEEFDRNEPAMTPNTLRPRQLPYAPIDSTRHNIYWPIRPAIRPIRVVQ